MLLKKILNFSAFALCCIFFLLSNNFSVFAQADSSTKEEDIVISDFSLYHFTIDEAIAPGAVRLVRKAIKEAEEKNAKLIILELNTFGGALDEADEIRQLILHSSIPFYAFIRTNAASAGALISIACERIYMSPESTIGSATVVNQNGEVLADKYQSYMRALMRSTAEVRGRNPDIAQAMVDPDFSIHGIVDSGKVLAFTANEAVKNGYCEGIYKNFDLLKSNLEKELDHNIIVEKQTLSSTDNIIHFLIQPWLSSILIMLIIGGIYFEMQSPGIGFALFVAIFAALLYFAPLYIEGLATHWEIVLFVVGIVLLALEIFVIPGFGVCGISGIALICGSLTLSMIDNHGFEFNHILPIRILTSLSVVVFSFLIAIPLCFFASRRLFTKKIAGRHLSLATEQRKEDGYIAVDVLNMQPLVGSITTAATVLRPGGKIMINNDLYDAYSESGFIEKGSSVKVMRFENAQFIVRKNLNS